MVTLCVLGCNADRRRRLGFRQYVMSAVRHADDLKYHFPSDHARHELIDTDNINQTEAQSAAGQRAMNLIDGRVIMTLQSTARAGRHHGVSTISLCAWYTNVTFNPHRVRY